MRFYNNTLNQNFWSEDNKFDPDIREKLLSITDDFIHNLDLEGVEIDDITNVYGNLSACSAALETAITDAVGVSSTKETTLIGSNLTNNPSLVEGVNSMREERNETFFFVF